MRVCPTNDLEWLNTRDLYVDYCHMSEVPEKAVLLIKKYGQFFDDKYAYWQPKGRKGQLLPLLKRRPIWMNGKRMPAEKHIPKWIDAKKQGQRRLLDAKQGESKC